MRRDAFATAEGAYEHSFYVFSSSSFSSHFPESMKGTIGYGSNNYTWKARE